MIDKILRFYTKYFAIWVVAFGVIAFVWPGLFVCMKGAMPWFFALTMFGIGAVLEVSDFKRITKRPVIVLIGSCAQFLIMPFGAFVLAKVFNLPPMIAAGLILTGSAPGAMASNVMCYVAKADTAYSVSLTTVSTLLCPILTPLLTWLLARSKVEVDFVRMMIDILLMVVVPLFAGFGLRHFFKRQVEKILPVFPAISVTFIIFICSMVIAVNKERLYNLSIVVIAAVIVLNVYGMLSGYGVGSLFRMERARRRTLSVEIGMQNAGLGTTLALAHFGDEAALPAAAFVFVCIITASIMAEIWQKKASGSLEKVAAD